MEYTIIVMRSIIIGILSYFEQIKTVLGYIVLNVNLSKLFNMLILIIFSQGVSHRLSQKLV